VEANMSKSHLSRRNFLQYTGLGAAAAGGLSANRPRPLLGRRPDLLQKAGVSWQVYTNDQVGDSGDNSEFFLGDYGDDPLWFHQQYNTTNSTQGGTGVLASGPSRSS
jgi:hypothetical protein